MIHSNLAVGSVDQILPLEARQKALMKLAIRLETLKEELAKALAKDLELTVRSVRDRELDMACKFLRYYGSNNSLKMDFSGHSARTALGWISIMLPYNAITATGSLSIGAAFLAGNSAILVRLPSGLQTFAPIYRHLVEDTLGNVFFIDNNGKTFLNYSYLSDDVNGVVIFGDDAWIDNYRRLALQTMKKTIFEGPGKDPFIVFSDADVEDAARAAIATGMANSGQDCASAERFFVHESIASEFREAVVENIKMLAVGSVFDERTDIGPISSYSVINRLKSQLAEAISEGAVVLTGGRILTIAGHRHETCEPTVLMSCHPKMKIMREETFGPIIPIATFRDEAEALALAEETIYGLTATVYGGPPGFAEELSRSHGNVFSNECIEDGSNSYARLHWGGFGRSGWIWEKQQGFFIQREGPRSFVHELSQQ